MSGGPLRIFFEGFTDFEGALKHTKLLHVYTFDGHKDCGAYPFNSKLSFLMQKGHAVVYVLHN